MNDLLAANEELYRAFESGDLERMSRVWAADDRAVCVHPGWPMLRGWDAVRDSWERILGNSAGIQFELVDVQAFTRGDVGWVILTELVRSSAGDPSPTSVAATNLFVREDGRCKLVDHHASAAPFRPERAPKTLN